jgi:hypothetical protein
VVSARVVEECGLKRSEADALVQRLGAGKVDLKRERGQQRAIRGALAVVAAGVFGAFSWHSDELLFDVLDFLAFIGRVRVSHDWIGLGLSALVGVYGLRELALGLRKAR